MTGQLIGSVRALLVVLAVVGTSASAQETSRPAAGAGRPAGFVHPGGLHTRADFDRMRAKVAAGEHPWIDGWAALIADRRAQTTWRTAPQGNMGVSRQRAQDDAMAAYLCAVRWRVSGDGAYADAAARNLNGWSAAVNQVPGGTDQPGLGGIPIGTFAIAAEVLRDYPGWTAADQARFKAMLLKYFYPAVNDFLTRHGGRHASHYWANWDASNVLALLAMGVYCDDRAKFDQGVEYYKSGIGMGSIVHAVQYLYPGGLGQWQESGRDHAHAFGGMGLLAEACQVAWNQGVDLFGYADDRLLAGANYEARYNQWIGVPYTFYTNSDRANQYYISTNYHGRLKNCEFYELLYNHYAVLCRRPVPDVERFAKLLRPEGGNVDLCGYGTLTYTLDAAASPLVTAVPPVPRDLVAAASAGRVFLEWSPSGAYTTRGYAVLRATDPGGPYALIFSTSDNTTPRFTDTKVENGKTYYYAVAAINQAGTSERSAGASATPRPPGALPGGWAAADVGSAGGSAGFGDVSGGTFALSGNGSGIGGATDSCRFVYRHVTGDFTLTARLTDATRVQKAGLMMRQAADPAAPSLAMTLGEAGGREARFGARAARAGKWSDDQGDDYTWLPIWLRLQRVGDTFIASQSSDGTSWFVVGKRDVPMGGKYLAGLALSSTEPKGEAAEATFDHVTLAVAPPAVPAAPRELTATGGADAITLAWATAAAGQDGFRVERSDDGKLFYEITSLPGTASRFVNTGVARRLYYRVRASNTGGFSDYSNVAEATAGASATAARGQ